MKTLKKTLCLVLALVMAFSLMSVASATNVEKYTDADKVGAAYEEAVDVLLGLGIVNGVSATEIAPEGYYTRAQAAKIATYLAVGPTVAEMLPAGESFTDVPATHWAAKYISYCAEKGILNGVSATEYAPEEKVTGYQFAKMVLAAAGYGQNNEFVGNGWAIATAQWALDADNDLFAGDAKAATNEPITRQQAMLIAFNALKNVEFQKYSKDEGVYTDISAATMGTKNYNLQPAYYAAVAGNAATGLTAGTTSILKATVETDGTISAFDTASTIKVDTDLAALGQIVKVWTTSSKVVSVQEASTTIAVAEAIDDADDLKAAFGTTLPAIADENVKVSADKVVSEAAVTEYDATTDAAVGTYVMFGGEVVGYIAPETVVATKVGTVTTTSGSESIVLTGVGAVSNTAANDDIIEYAGIKEGDIVTYVKAGDIYTVSKAATVEGKITKNANGTLTVNGTEYKAFAGTDNSAIVDDSINFTSTFTLYLASANEYFAIKAKSDDTSVDAGIVYTTLKYQKNVDAVKDEFGATVTEAAVLNFVQGVDSTGAEVNYQLTATEYAAIAANKLYTVETDYDSTLKATVADLTELSEEDTYGGIATPAAATLTAQSIKVADGYYFASNVKFIYVSETGSDLTVTVKEGVQALTATNVAYYGTKAAASVANYDVQYVFVAAPYAADLTGEGVMAGFEAADSTTVVPYTKADGTTGNAYVHTVYIDGVKTEIKTATATAISGFSTYTYDETTGLYAVADSYAAVKSGKITNNYNGKITSGATYVDVDVTGAKLVNVVASTDANYSKIATTATALTTHETVSIVLDGEGNAVVVYITAYTA